jgi:hypothetical protein
MIRRTNFNRKGRRDTQRMINAVLPLSISAPLAVGCANARGAPESDFAMRRMDQRRERLRASFTAPCAAALVNAR